MTRHHALLVTCALSLTFASAVHAQERALYGTYVRVESAEKVVFDYGEGRYDVRVFGIDAPEMGQPHAGEAAAFLRQRLEGQSGVLRFFFRNDADEMVATVWLGQSDLGLEMVRQGLVWRQPDARYKPFAEDQPDRLTDAEAEARRERRGIFADPYPVTPWDWRHEHRVAEPPAAVGSKEGLKASGGVDRNTSQKSGNDSECAIAQSPADPSRLFVLCNTAGSGLFAARSTDGGDSWIYPDPGDKTIADGDSGQGTSACCDPTLAWDRFGNLFVTYISSNLSNIVTLLSTDDGATFSPLASFSGSIDQPTVTTANVGAGSAVWVVWNQSGSMVARGAEVTTLGSVGSFTALQTAPSTSSCTYGDVAISPTGVVVQVCGYPSGGEGPGSLRINIDADGLGAGGFGATASTIATNVGGFDFIPPQNGRSVDPESGLAYDRNPASPVYGRLYLVYTDETANENDDTEIMVRTSNDDGATWSSPIRVNDDATVRSQFLPKIATDPASGTVAVCWHDARNSATNTAAELYCSFAEPAATPVFSANKPLSDGASTSNGQGVEYGDYMGMAMAGGEFHPVWGDISNSTGDNPNGTSSFDAYSDYLEIQGILFGDNFENGNTNAWSAVVP